MSVRGVATCMMSDGRACVCEGVATCLMSDGRACVCEGGSHVSDV